MSIFSNQRSGSKSQNNFTVNGNTVSDGEFSLIPTCSKYTLNGDEVCDQVFALLVLDTQDPSNSQPYGYYTITTNPIALQPYSPPNGATGQTYTHDCSCDEQEVINILNEINVDTSALVDVINELLVDISNLVGKSAAVVNACAEDTAGNCKSLVAAIVISEEDGSIEIQNLYQMLPIGVLALYSKESDEIIKLFCNCEEQPVYSTEESELIDLCDCVPSQLGETSTLTGETVENCTHFVSFQTIDKVTGQIKYFRNYKPNATDGKLELYTPVGTVKDGHCCCDRKLVSTQIVRKKYVGTSLLPPVVSPTVLCPCPPALDIVLTINTSEKTATVSSNDPNYTIAPDTVNFVGTGGIVLTPTADPLVVTWSGSGNIAVEAGFEECADTYNEDVDITECDDGTNSGTIVTTLNTNDVDLSVASCALTGTRANGFKDYDFVLNSTESGNWSINTEGGNPTAWASVATGASAYTYNTLTSNSHLVLIKWEGNGKTVIYRLFINPFETDCNNAAFEKIRSGGQINSATLDLSGGATISSITWSVTGNLVIEGGQGTQNITWSGCEGELSISELTLDCGVLAVEPVNISNCGVGDCVTPSINLIRLEVPTQPNQWLVMADILPANILLAQAPCWSDYGAVQIVEDYGMYVVIEIDESHFSQVGQLCFGGDECTNGVVQTECGPVSDCIDFEYCEIDLDVTVKY